MKILVLNAGSSSQKSCLYEIDGNDLPVDPPEPRWQAQLDWNDLAGSADLKVKTDRGEELRETFPSTSKLDDTLKVIETLERGRTRSIDKLEDIDIVGHRVVHGGEKYRDCVRIDAVVKAIGLVS